jgi:hypothetical protein
VLTARFTGLRVFNMMVALAQQWLQVLACHPPQTAHPTQISSTSPCTQPMQPNATPHDGSKNHATMPRAGCNHALSHRRSMQAVRGL